MPQQVFPPSQNRSIMAPQVPPGQNLGQNVNLPGNEMGSHSNTMPSGGMPNIALQQQQQQQQLSNLVPGSRHMIANAHFQPTYAGTGCYIIYPIHFTVYIYTRHGPTGRGCTMGAHTAHPPQTKSVQQLKVVAGSNCEHHISCKTPLPTPKYFGWIHA